MKTNTFLKRISFIKKQHSLMLFCLFLATLMHGQIAPTAFDDEIYTFDNVQTSGTLAINDLNPSGSTLTYTLITNTTNGFLDLQPSGSYVFTPNPDAAGINETLSYQVCDNIGQCDVGAIALYIAFHNDLPQANNDNITVEINEPRFGNVAENDFDPDYLTDPVSTQNNFTVIVNATHGDLIFNLDGTFQYTPNLDYTGTDSFTYLNCDACSTCSAAVVTVTVIGNNLDPDVSDSPTISMNEDTNYSGDAASLAIDPENDPLQFSVVIAPTHGLVIMNNDGSFSYTPDPNYYGTDNFLFIACDIVGQCGAGHIYFDIQNQNDAPIVAGESYSTNEDISNFTGNISTNDYDDNGTINYTLALQPSHGTVSIDNNGSFNYIPYANYYGADSFTVDACDNELLCSTDLVEIDITPLNDYPVVVNDDTFGYEDTPITGTVANDTDIENDPLTYAFVSASPQAFVTMNANGSYVLTTTPNFAGFLNVTYQVCDSYNACTTGTFEVEVIEINDNPVINSDSYSGNEDTIITGNVNDNDFDPDIEPLNYLNTTTPLHGVLVLSPIGTFSYTPNANWYGTETISIYGCDPCSVCILGTLTLNVLPVNDSPVTANGSGTTNEDTSLSNTLASLASDIEGDALTFTTTSNAGHGTFVLNADGTFMYTPVANYFGDDQISFSVCDGSNACASGIYTITINPVNDTPVAMDDNTNTLEDIFVNGSLANDSDIDDVNLYYEVISNPMNGTISIAPNGDYIYTPGQDFYGVDMVTYSVCDASNACDAAVLVIQVDPINDGPVAMDDTNVTYQNDALSGSVASDDYDVDGDALTYSLITTSANGAFVLNNDGSYTYTPNLDFSGNDQVTYQACDPSNACSSAQLFLTIYTVNTAPIAHDTTITIFEDIPLSKSLDVNILDEQGGVMSYSLISAPSNGTLNLGIDGNFIYTPSSNYHGPDSFTYHVCDTGNMCDNATVYITITSVNDIPVVLGESNNTQEETTITGNVSFNDSDADGDVLAFSLISTAQHGAFVMQPNGAYTYTPQTEFNGTETIQYNVCDLFNACTQGTLILNVSAVNDPPVAMSDAFSGNEDEIINGSVVLNDNDPDNNTFNFTVITSPLHGNVNLQNDGSFVYTPFANYHGSDNFVYWICDSGSLCAQTNVALNIASVNDTPIALNDSQSVTEDNSTSGTVASNDSDLDNDVLVYSTITNAINGTFTLEQNGNYTYSPSANYFGTESITIQACDPSGACVQSNLFIAIASVNDFPIAQNDSFVINEDNNLTGNINFNDSDIDDLTLTYTTNQSAQFGVLTLNPNGSFTYTPNINANGNENISYSVCDASGACANAILTIQVNPVNDSPSASGEFVHVQEDESGTGDLALNDIDPDGEALTYSILLNTLHGTLNLNASGTFDYTPVPNYSGMDSLTYMVCDPNNACVMAKLLIQVDFVNDAPVVVDEAIEIIVNTNASGDLSANDLEFDGEVLTYFILTDNSGGLFTLNENGMYTYTPADGVTGTFTLEYRACDPCNICDQGVITIYVVPKEDANTAPTALNSNQTICHGASAAFDMSQLISDTQDSAFNMNIEFTDPASGIILFDAESRVLTYSSFPDYVGDIVINYTVCDNGLVPLCADGSLSVSFSDNVLPSINGYTTQNIDCFGNSNGSIDIVDVTGGNNFNYVWENNDETQDRTNLPVGHYSVTITSDANCSLPQTFEFDITGPDAPLNASIQATTNISDAGNGAIGILIEGGTADYSVQWTGPNGYASSNEDLTDLINDGTYDALITDANNCTAQVQTTILGQEELTKSFTLYASPNPFNEEIQLRLSGGKGQNFYYTIYDAQGKLVVKNNLGMCATKTIAISTSELAAGCYQLQVYSKDFSKSIKMVKQ